MHLALLPNPSHLEAVNPRVVGKCRAKMDLKGDATGTSVLPVIIHGDAAFAGPPWSKFFDQTDVFIETVAAPLDAARQAHAPETELVMNEYVPQVGEWCHLNASESRCPPPPPCK